MANQAFIPIGVDPPAPLSDEACTRAMKRNDLSAAWLAHALRERGIQIDRMTAPRFIDQLLNTGSRPIDTVLCVALDADPTAEINTAVASAFPSDVRLGVECLAKFVGAPRAVIVADNGARSIRVAGRRSSDNPRLVAIDHSYPQLHPSLLLQLVLKRRLLAGRLPVEAGVVVIDAAAAGTIARLVAEGEGPFMPLVVRDHRTGRSAYAVTTHDLTLADLLASLRLELSEHDTVIGGELLLRKPADLASTIGRCAPVLHVCRCTDRIAAEPCVRCNWCADVCPTGVLPMLALEAAQFNDIAHADRARIGQCIECGLCDYVCPSRLALVSAIRVARQIELPASVESR